MRQPQTDYRATPATCFFTKRDKPKSESASEDIRSPVPVDGLVGLFPPPPPYTGKE